MPTPNDVEIPQPVQPVSTGGPGLPPPPPGFASVSAPETQGAGSPPPPPGFLPAGQRADVKPSAVQGAAPAAPSIDMQEMSGGDEAAHLADTGLSAVGSGIDTAAKAVGLGSRHVKEGLEEATRASGAEAAGDVIGQAVTDPKALAAKTITMAHDYAKTKMAEAHKRVEEDQETATNATKLMKHGQLREAAELIDRHMAIRTVQAIVEQQRGRSIAEIPGEIVTEAANHIRKGDYGKAVGLIGGTAAPLAMGLGEGAAVEETGAQAAAKAATTEATEGVSAGVSAATKAKTAGTVAEAAEPGMLKPGTTVVPGTAGEQIPVRAQGTVAKAAENLMSDEQKARLQEHADTQTNPAVRRAASNVAGNAAETKAAPVITKEDPIGMHGAADQLHERAKPVFQAIDEQTGNAFSDAQADAKKYARATDSAGIEKYDAAIAKQEQIFDSIRALAGKGEIPDLTVDALDNAKADWKQGIKTHKLAQSFDGVIENMEPAAMKKAGLTEDPGVLNPNKFQNAINKGVRRGPNGTPSLFEQAGYTPAHVESLQELGRVLKGQEVKFSTMTSRLAQKVASWASEGVGTGLGYALGGPEGAAIGAAVPQVAKGIQRGVGWVMSHIMSDTSMLDTISKYLPHFSPDSMVTRLMPRLKELAKDETGSMVVPFTGSGRLGDTVGTAEGAKADTNFFKQAQSEKPNASLSEQMQHADKLKQDAKSQGSGLGKLVANSADDIAAAANKTAQKRESNLKPVESVAQGANDYNKSQGLPAVRHEPAKVDRRTADIADAFDAMKHDPNNPAVKRSYQALKHDVKKQWNYAEKKLGIKFEPVDVDPYHSEKELLDDVANNHRLKVFRGGNPLKGGHPLAEIDPKTGESYNTIFRAVHDLFGHTPAANDFSEAGEEAAWNAHRQMFSKDAIPALTTETRGQTSWFYNNKAVRAGEPLGKYAEQKAGILPDFAQKQTPEPSSISYKYNPDLAATNNAHTVTTIGSEGNKIGELVAQDTGNAKRGQVTVRSNQVYDPANRGQGLGQKHIETLIDEVSKNPDIKAVKSDISTTPDAQRVWEKLEQKYPHAIEKKMVGKGESAKPVWTVDLDAIREDKAAGPVPQNAAPVLPSPDMRTPGSRISQRSPSGVTSTEDPVAENLLIGRPAIERADAVKPGYKAKLATKVSEYPGIKISPEEAAADPDAALNKFTKHIADNLVWLHNQIPDKIRNISKLWYDSAHELTKSWAKDYGLEHEQMAGMVAALSPQNEWNNNIEVAKRVADIAKNQTAAPWQQEMETNAQRILAKQGEEADIKAVHDAVRGKKLSELTDPVEKAWWIRLYDESFNPRQHLSYAPDGSTRGFARTPVGQQLSTTKWSSLDAIAKAVSIMEDGSKANISAKLGDAHKVRNFYNNIIDPWSSHGDVTIDTHAVGAGHLRPMGGSTEEVLHNFGGGGINSSKVAGVRGTYGLYADAYRQAAAKLGILPRELQSITWEGVRALYETAGKTDELKTKIAQIWKDHKNGEITIDRARKQILKDAGGFKRPKWATEPALQPDSGVAPKKQPASDKGVVPSAGQARSAGR